MRNRKLSSKFSTVLALFIITTSFILLPSISRATDPKPATGFIYPVLGDGVTDPTQNTVDPRPGGTACSDAVAGDTTKWHTNGNDFGNNYCPPSLGCGWDNCYHPGEDWNLCSGGNVEGGENVYAIANGKVVRSTTVLGSGSTSFGYYLTIEHTLLEEENLSDYALAGTTTTETFTTVNSTYAHINNPLVAENDIVEKGDVIATISSCCGHLHFEMKSQGENITGCSSCGYCSSRQSMTDSHFLEPDKFIREHVEGIDIFDNCQFYPDVWYGKWYFWPIMKLSCLGIVQGYQDGYFRPGNTVNRAEMVKMIVEASGAQCEDGCNRDMPFWDITNENEWYYPYIKLAYNNDWLPDESECDFLPCVPPAFNPGIPASRGWIAHVLIGALDWENGAYRLISPFDDLANGDEGYKDVARTYQLNIFSGYEDKDCSGNDAQGEVNFCYSNSINRAEAAAVIERAFLRESAYE